MANEYFSFYRANGIFSGYQSFDVDDIAGIEASVPAGGGYIEGRYNFKTEYVVAGVVTPRPALDVETSYSITADGVDAVTFDIPDGTNIMTVSLDEREANNGHSSYVEDVADGDDTFTFTARRPGRWELTVTPPEPTQEYEIIVGAI